MKINLDINIESNADLGDFTAALFSIGAKELKVSIASNGLYNFEFDVEETVRVINFMNDYDEDWRSFCIVE